MAEIQRIPRTLQDNEAVIKRGLIQVWEVAAALADIREQKQYREAGFKTFEEYCQERWNFSRQYAASLIQAKEVVENIREKVNDPVNTLSTMVDKLPQNERQVRIISEATKEPAVQAEVWATAVEDAGGEQPTAPQIREAAAKVTASKTHEPTEDEDDGEEAGPLDHFGKAVDSAFADAFAERDAFKSFLSDLTQLKRKLKALSSGAGGKWLHYQEAESALKDLRIIVDFAMPYTECGFCQRDPKKRQSCDACKHRGWVCEKAYGNFTNAAKAWVESR
jgi:hypothetical protein